MLIKIQALWDMMPYEQVGVTDISVELSAFLFTAQTGQKILKIKAASS